jgi:curli biogenesis system outer membrane secretion channel CsgG
MKRLAASFAALAAAFVLPLVAVATEPAAAAAVTKAKKFEKTCEATATSRIRRGKAGDCATETQPTRTFTQRDLESTGQFDMGEALRRLDPRLQ